MHFSVDFRCECTLRVQESWASIAVCGVTQFSWTPVIFYNYPVSSKAGWHHIPNNSCHSAFLCSWMYCMQWYKKEFLLPQQDYIVKLSRVAGHWDYVCGCIIPVSHEIVAGSLSSPGMQETWQHFKVETSLFLWASQTFWESWQWAMESVNHAIPNSDSEKQPVRKVRLKDY